MKNRQIGKELRTGKLPNGYTLTYEDVGHWLDSDYGHIIMADVGKRIFLSGGVIQMENSQQKQERVGMDL